MAKRGRKPIEINWEEFEALCAIQATLREMECFFGCSEDTLERAVKRQYHASGVLLLPAGPGIGRSGGYYTPDLSRQEALEFGLR